MVLCQVSDSPPSALCLTLIQPHWSSCSLSTAGRLLLQGAGTCCSLCLDGSFPGMHMAHSHTLFTDAILDRLPRTAIPNLSFSFFNFLLYFPSWNLLLANKLHHLLICFIVCILSLHCELHEGKSLHLLCLVMYLECLLQSLAYVVR